MSGRAEEHEKVKAYSSVVVIVWANAERNRDKMENDRISIVVVVVVVVVVAVVAVVDVVNGIAHAKGEAHEATRYHVI